MATRKPLVVVSGASRQIADADALAANGGIDRTTAGALVIGATTATSVQLGSTTIPTTVPGNLTVTGSLTAQGSNVLGLVQALQTNTFLP